MLIFDLPFHPEIKIRFSYSEKDIAPEQSGCYVITTPNGTILYIGRTDNIRSRMKQHLDDKEKTKLTPLGKPDCFYYKLCSARDLKSLEYAWVHEHKLNSNGKRPYFNKNDPSI